MNIINKISNLNITGYYDDTNGYVVAWFHNVESNKPDIVSYLKNDMSWDVREVKSEISIVSKDREVIEIKHNNLGSFGKGSTFDILIRKMLEQFIKNMEQNNQASDSILKMKEILNNNSYINLILN